MSDPGKPKWRPWTAADDIALLSSRAAHQPGDLCQPMIVGTGGREVVRVVERIEDQYGVHYIAERFDGSRTTVYISDDPRPVSPGTELG
jgi:nucleoside-diphosphate-sugar epimerase